VVSPFETASLIDTLHFFLPKVIVATLCGGLVGIEREMKHKVAGVKTNALVCVGVSIFTAFAFYVSDAHNVDPTRIIGQVVTGVGFLGAGAIFKAADRVIGLTTAAFIWVVSAMGVLIGAGALKLAILLTLGLLVVTVLFDQAEKRFRRSQDEKTLT